MTSRPVRVLLVEDHFVSRFGLRGLLEDAGGFEIAGEAKNGREAVALFGQLRPDVVLMDVRLPEVDGVQATYAIRTIDPNARVLVLSSYDTQADVVRARDAGAAGYIKKEAEPEEILEAIGEVAAGRPFFDETVERQLEAHAAEGSLRARDVRILQLIALGCTNKDVGEALSLSEGTVRVYVSRILAKLGVGNRAEAVSLAIKKGLITAGTGK